MKIDQFLETPPPPQEVDGIGESETPRYQRPTKYKVRLWLARVIASRRPPPSIGEIQKDLWYMNCRDEDGGNDERA